MAKKKEIPLSKKERILESIKRTTITLIATMLGYFGLLFIGVELDPGTLTLVAVGVVEFFWKLIRTGSYTKKA